MTESRDATPKHPARNKRNRSKKQMKKNLAVSIFTCTDQLNQMGRHMLRDDIDVEIHPHELSRISDLLLDCILIVRQIRNKIDILGQLK